MFQEKSSAILDRREIDANGFVEVFDNPVSIVGVYPYVNPPGSNDPNKVYMVYRSADELSRPETLDSLRLMPIVDLHPTAPAMLGASSDAERPEEKGVHGSIGEKISFDSNGKQGAGIYANLKFYSFDMLDKIDNQGIKELSPGYWAEYDYTPGEWNGIAYDAIQRNIIFNHLALVPQGRQGQAVSVMDNMPINLIHNSTTDLPQPTNEAKKMPAHSPEKLQKLAESIVTLLSSFLSEEQAEGMTQDMDDEDMDKVLDSDDKDKDDEGTKDKCDESEEKEAVKDEDEKDDKKEGSMDAAMISSLVQAQVAKALGTVAVRDSLYAEVKPLIGVMDASEMTAEQLAAYSLDKLGIKATKGQEMATLQGYLAGVKRHGVQDSVIDHTSGAKSKLSLKDFV